MFDNLTPEEATIAYIIRAYKSFENMISQYDIADAYTQRQMVNITPRRVRRIIEKLVKDGYPIISSPGGVEGNGGYCWYGKDGEALRCYKRLRSKGIKILLRARYILRNSRQEQQKLFD